jgi:hypothetical protein
MVYLALKWRYRPGELHNRSGRNKSSDWNVMSELITFMETFSQSIASQF